MITVLGASGFIGSHLVRYLQQHGIEHQAPARHERLAGRDLGHIIYCIGLTADFRDRPFDAVEAHVSKLVEILRTATFESILYLSSIRLYAGSNGVARETDDLRFNPAHFEDIYTLSKATGEAVVLALGPKGRVVRISTAYGVDQPQSFLGSIIQEAIREGRITLRSALESERDYISIDDLVPLLVRIATNGRHQIYNAGGGKNVTNGEVTAAISALTGCTVSVVADAPKTGFARIDCSRIEEEFGFSAARVLDDLPRLVAGGDVPSQPGEEWATGDVAAFDALSDLWLSTGLRMKYSYMFTWMGRPVIQFPDDLLRLQEIVFAVQPDVIIETGIAHGGSLIFHASLCKVLEHGRVIGVDIEIRPHNRAAIEAHPLKPLITLIEGSSTDPRIVGEVRSLVAPGETVLIILDSNHTKAHVRAELEAYSTLVAPGSFIVVMDGYLMELAAPDRPDSNWASDNPNAAVRAFAAEHPEFAVEDPALPFNESAIRRPVIGFRGGLLRRISMTVQAEEAAE
ncbi:MAG TPA: CmcI family methyltransferase [Thermoanaerobaculia bacterium]|nr:CmcI family methyltransferase [Thermoanaerobaculia bacterium]